MDADQRPRTVAALREHHLALMREWRATTDDAARCAAAAAFRHEVEAAGIDIAGTAERDEAQGIIDYWASAIAGLPGVSYPEILTLAPYSGAAAQAAGQDAARTYAALGSEEERRAARQLFQHLLDQGPDGVERARPQTRDMLRRRIRSNALDGVLARFAETGAITRLPAGTPDDDRFEVSDAGVLDQWPELAGWLREQQSYYTEREAVVAQAERWQAGGEDRDLLATGRRVDTLERYRGQTALVDRFIDRSREAKRRRAFWRSLGGLAMALSVLAAIVAIQKMGDEIWQLNRDKVELKDDIATIEEQKPTTAVQAQPVGREAPAPSPDLLPAVSTGPAAAPRPGLSGALWLGSATRSQVRPADPAARRILPADAVPGTRYRVPAAITLRDGMPDPDGPYVSRAQKALVPAGSLVVVEGAPRAYARPSGMQYWADVRVVPRVYLQYAGDRAAAERLRAQVRDAGFDVPAAEETAKARNLREVRWSHDQDRPAAALLARSLEEGGAVACRSLAGRQVRNAPFILELWVDFAARRADAPRGTEAC